MRRSAELHGMERSLLFAQLERHGSVFKALLQDLSPAEITWKPAPEKWCPLEVICHLHDEEREDFRRRLDMILNHPGEEWPPINPRGWVVERGYNQRNLAEMLDGFDEERRISLMWLETLDEPDWEAGETFEWGTMKAGDMLASWAAHDKLHLRQLVELRYGRVKCLADPYGVQYAGDW